MDRKPNKKRKIPFQARRLVREVLSGKHKTIASAGKAAGYSGSAANRALANLQGTMSEIMDAAGITDAHLVQNCIAPLLHATTKKLGQYKGKSRMLEPTTTHAYARWILLCESKGNTLRWQ